MAIKYAIQQIKQSSLTDHTTQTRYYAQAKYDGVTAQEDLAQMVSQISALSVGDVLSVMNTLSMLLSIELTNGRIVDLGDLGRFRASLRSRSAESPEAFKRDMIYGNKVIFVPGAQIRQKLQKMNCLKMESPLYGSHTSTSTEPHEGDPVTDPVRDPEDHSGESGEELGL